MGGPQVSIQVIWRNVHDATKMIKGIPISRITNIGISPHLKYPGKVMTCVAGC